MRALRYLLMIIGLASVLSLCAQGLAQQPQAEMHSTSAMVSSGSALPQAAVTGTKTTYDVQTHGRPGNIRRGVGDGDGFEDEDDPDAPGEPFPIGDALWPLALCALAYLLWRVARKRTRLTR